jgi:hypothetical protein
LLACVCGVVLACDGGSSTSGGYASEELWLCRPDIEDDKCDAFDLSFTEIHADGSTVVRNIAVNPDAEIDCFYVYPTVDDKSGAAGNTEVLSKDDPLVLRALRRDAARFRGVCRLFAPLYRQMTLETYSDSEWLLRWEGSPFFEKAYGDVVEAFEYYMEAHNGGRAFVLLGHSQGAHMLIRLLKDRFDEDGALLAQLISALLVGPTGRVFVPDGERVGGTFSSIPLCSTKTDTACVLAFDSGAAGLSSDAGISMPIPLGMRRACVNPALLSSGSTSLAAFEYPRDVLLVPSENGSALPFPSSVDTEWVSYPELHEAQCNVDVHPMLKVGRVEQDPRSDVPTPQEIEELGEEFGSGGLHWAETFMTAADLIRLVEAQVESRSTQR